MDEETMRDHEYVQRKDQHDEAMRMQALAIGAALVGPSQEVLGMTDGERYSYTEARLTQVRSWAQITYRDATGREW